MPAVSWDIYVMDLPADARTLADIPHDYKPGPLMPRAELIEGISRVVPDVDFSDPTWGVIDGPGFSIEVSIRADDPVESFSFHVRGGDMAAAVVADILDHLGLQAVDPQTKSGLFDRETAVASLTAWRAYRDRVIGERPGPS